MGVFWVDSEKTRKFRLGREVLLTFLLLAQAWLGAGAIRADWAREYSSGKRFADYLKERSELKDAVVIGEPDFNIETLPYYADNPIYIVREKRFGNTVRFTTASQPDLSLGELLDAAESVKTRSQKPVLIALEYSLDPSGPLSFQEYFGRTFRFSPDERLRFLSRTEKLGVFRGAVVENYDVYLLK